MDHQNVAGVFLNPHRRSLSGEHRFSASILSPTKPSASTNHTADDSELNEADVFFSTTSAEPAPKPAANHRLRRHQNTGILSALPEPAPASLFSPSRSIPAIPKPVTIPHSPEPKTAKYSQSMPAKGSEKSKPMSVPIYVRKGEAVEDYGGGDDDDDGEMLPPHEIVARNLVRQRGTTSFSVLEGVGRTLKGKDLRQVRNAVWKQTGFLDQ